MPAALHSARQIAPNSRAEERRWSFGADGRGTRFAQRRVSLVCWPRRASSRHHSSIGVPLGSRRLICARRETNFFKIGNVIALLAAVAWPGRELAIAHNAKLAPEGVACDWQLELVPDPLRQIAQPPAHYSIRCRNRPCLDDFKKAERAAYRSGSNHARSLVRRQTAGTCLVEAQNLVVLDLQRPAGYLRRFTAAPTVQDQRDSQQTSDLFNIATSSRESTQIHRGVVRSNPNRCRHRKPPSARNVESDFQSLGNPRRELDSARPGTKRANLNFIRNVKI